MKRSYAAIITLVILAVGGAVGYTRYASPKQTADAQQPSQSRSGRGQNGERPPISVMVAKAESKPMPVRLDAIGSVQTIASVTVRPRVDSQITEVLVQDGSMVKEGDVLFKLDDRQIQAQIAQAEANVARDNSSLTFAGLDLKRAEELARRDFVSNQQLETARTAVNTQTATLKASEAALNNLNVQETFYTIKAPLSGKAGVVGLRAGNITRSADASPLVTINQIMPIYVTFSMPQRQFPAIREAIAAGSATVLATPQGYSKGATGRVAVIDNTVDATTGTIGLRAEFENADELLWPGALCAVRVTLRTEPDAIAIPREALQTSQTGSFVYVAEDNIAKVRPVTVARTVDGEAVIASGLSGGETVVTDGALLLVEGARLVVRDPSKPSAKPASTKGPPTANGSDNSQQKKTAETGNGT